MLGSAFYIVTNAVAKLCVQAIGESDDRTHILSLILVHAEGRVAVVFMGLLVIA